MGTAPTAKPNGVKMNKFGIVIFLISTLLSGFFVIAAESSSEEERKAADAMITGETTYDEYYSNYYTCTANIHFSYKATEDGSIEKNYTGTTTGSMESSQPCVDDIEAAFPIDSYIRIYFSTDDPTDYSFQAPSSSMFLYYCCSGFFGILAVLGLVVTLMMGAKSSSVPTGGLSSRMSNFGSKFSGNKSMQIKPDEATFPTLPSQQENPAFNQVKPNKSRRRKRWKDGNMTQGRVRNYNSIISRMGLKNRGFDDIKEAKAHALSFGIMSHSETEAFFANDHVLRTLGLSQSTPFIQNITINDSVVMGNPASSLNSNKGFWSNQNISTSKSQGSEETCGYASCSSEVDSFDFRCFDCRKRFCNAHRGKTFKCDSCEN